jgi:hypothetical protein
MKAPALLFLVATALGLASCDYDTGVRTLDTLVTWMQVGSDRDYWIEQKSKFEDRRWDKVALVFGYADDFEACSDMRDGLRSKYPKSQYRCVPAN